MEKDLPKQGIEYDPGLDILYIYNNPDKEKILGSLPIANLIFDIGLSGKLVGLEIDNASKLFGVKTTILSSAKSAKLMIKKQNNVFFLGFKIMLPQKEYNFSYIVSPNKIALPC